MPKNKNTFNWNLLKYFLAVCQEGSISKAAIVMGCTQSTLSRHIMALEEEFGILLFDYLNQFKFYGWKLGFWFSQQGAIYFFVLLIFIYVWQMNRLDRRFGVEEE